MKKNNFLWIIICIAVLLVCISIPEIYFRAYDKKNLNSVKTNEISYVNLSISNNLSLYDKIAIINNGYTRTDLNYDYTDEFSYSDVHDITMDELSTLFTDNMGIDIYIDGIYEMIIEKHLIISETDSSRNFTAWVVAINYFGFDLNCMLDYDTCKIIALSIDVNPNNNSYYQPDKLRALEYYDTAILPLTDYLHERYKSPKYDSDDEYDYIPEEYADILASYYGIDDIYADYASDSSIGKYTFNFTYKDKDYSIQLTSRYYTLSINGY